MKYLKKYENINPRLDDLKKLLDHLTKVIKRFGYDYSNFFEHFKYEVEFRNEKELVFTIEGDFSVSLIYLSVNLRIGSFDDDLSKFFSEYFKTIDGLTLYNESSSFFVTTFRIDGDVNEIIKQITKEDIEMKYQGNKFNI